MRIFIDTEFIEGPDDIYLVSIGLVKENGETYYAELAPSYHYLANKWVRDNVLSVLTGPVKFKEQIALDLVKFCKGVTEFWAYGIPEIDYNLMVRLCGYNIPIDWPSGAYEVSQRLSRNGSFILPPEQKTVKHHALNDAIWAKEIYESSYK